MSRAAKYYGRTVPNPFVPVPTPDTQPYWDTEGPRSVAIVELAEGPRLTSSVVGCEQTPEALQLDMALTATFVPFDDVTLLCFEPAEGTA